MIDSNADIQDDHLMARWVQLGCFSPFLRLHSSDSPFNTREPWAFSSESHSTCAKFLQFRHRLVPYLYSVNADSTDSYKSLVEPVYYDYPERDEAYAHRNQFMFGSELLVVPVVSPTSSVTKLGKAKGWLPPGRWVDIFEGLVYEGDRVLSFYRSLDKYPVFAKEGAIIPLDGKIGGALENGCPTPESIEILLFPGKDGHFDLVEDDGTGAEISQIKLSRTPIKYSQAEGKLTIGPTSNPLLKERSYTVRILGGSAKNVEINGSSKSADKGVIDIGKQSTSEAIEVKFQFEASSGKEAFELRKKQIFERLTAAQMDLVQKGSIWDAVKSEGGLLKIISRLDDIEAPEDMKAAVMELLLAE
jgi:alpha-glucosidase (family GH31 glycosyl hydrolase)